jgi:sulfur carrier protein ThiS
MTESLPIEEHTTSLEDALAEQGFEQNVVISMKSGSSALRAFYQQE